MSLCFFVSFVVYDLPMVPRGRGWCRIWRHYGDFPMNDSKDLEKLAKKERKAQIKQAKKAGPSGPESAPAAEMSAAPLERKPRRNVFGTVVAIVSLVAMCTATLYYLTNFRNIGKTQDLQVSTLLDEARDHLEDASGGALGDTKSYELARRSLEKVLILEPDNAEALSLLGLCAFGLGDAQEALDCFEKALALDPGNLVYQANRDVARGAMNPPPPEKTLAPDSP